MSRSAESAAGVIAALFMFFVLLLGVGGCCYVVPQYKVYSERMGGEAELARADSNRKIATLEANAKLESSKALADAEIVRARGVAEANRIIGDSLSGNEAYLRYLWIDGLQNGSNQIIYVPTEANLPILEASRGQ